MTARNYFSENCNVIVTWFLLKFLIFRYGTKTQQHPEKLVEEDDCQGTFVSSYRSTRSKVNSCHYCSGRTSYYYFAAVRKSVLTPIHIPLSALRARGVYRCVKIPHDNPL